ncbi:MAG: response regulator, partial [Myxococcota bacterium]
MEVAQSARIGRILVDMGKVSPRALDRAAAALPDRPLRLASRLHSLCGYSEADLLPGLAIQKGLPGVALRDSVIDLAALGAIPREVAMEGHFLPLSMEGGRLHVAFANPEDHALIDEITFVTGAEVLPYVALQGVLDEAIAPAFGAAERGEALFSVGGKTRGVPELQRIEPSAGEPAAAATDEEEVLSISVEIEDEPLEPMKPESRVGGNQGEGRRLLVVDDEPEILHLLGTAFAKAGYRVETASRGIEALEKIRAFDPEVVLLDAMLPEVHGFEICRKIRSSKRFGHVPVVMISAVYRGWRFAQDVEEVYGASDFIEKPFRIADVLARVGAVLGGAEERSEASGEAREKAARAYRRGVGMLKVGKVEGAIRAFQEGIGSDPFSPAL